MPFLDSLNGAAGKVLGMSVGGVLSWLTPSSGSTSLSNGQIWIGDATNTATGQTLSGDATVSNTGVITIQDNSVDGTDLTITGESNGSLMYFNGTNWINLGIGTTGQVLAILGGIPTWTSLPAAPTVGNLTTSTSGVNITGGTGAVIGSGATVNVSTNAVNQAGLVSAPTATNALKVWGTDASGNPSWTFPTALISVDNGLNYNGISGKIRQGGALVENTTITQANFNYIHSLSGTGVFEARNGVSSGAGLYVNPSNNVGIGTASPADKLHVVGTARITSLQTATTPSANTDKLVWANANGTLHTLPTGTAGEVLTLDASGLPDWAAASGAGWLPTGNTLSGIGIFGSLNNQDIDFYLNNTVRGRMKASSGSFIWGGTASPYSGESFTALSTLANTFAISGYCSHNGAGVWGETRPSSSGGYSAVQGYYGGTGSGAGALGNYAGSNSSLMRAGVVGLCTAPTSNDGGIGVYGKNTIASGTLRIGVLGEYATTASGLGVVGIAAGGGIMSGVNDVAIVGWRANTQNYSGYFNGNHAVANGTKSASVPTTKGNQLLYCMESPEVWFEDFGTAELVNGTATVQLDDLFLETVLIDAKHPLHVFVQVQGECEDVYVVPNTNSFQVKEKNNGTSNVKFSYRVVAKRYHFADHRFGNDPIWGKGDTREYSQKAPARPIDYDEAVKMDLEAKKNYKRTKMPEGFIYTEDFPQPEIKRPTSQIEK